MRVSVAGPPVPTSSHESLGQLVAAYVSRQGKRSVDADADELVRSTVSPLTIGSTEVVRAGRPGLISVIAELPGATVHGVLGLRRPGDESNFLDHGDDSPLGIFEDPDGLAVVFDATSDAELALLLRSAIAGPDAGFGRVQRTAVTHDSVSLTFDDRQLLTIFERLASGGGAQPGLEQIMALDSVGFNHLQAPVALWRRDGTDLGIVQEHQAGSAGGWSLALTSLRDLYASGMAPESAGADFAPESRRLGTMTARMHLGFDRAFGRKSGDIPGWVAEVERAVRAVDPHLLDDRKVTALLADLKGATSRCAAIRTHGDFHLGRVARTDLGWLVLDFSPGGTPQFTAGLVEADGPVFRSPLADVADMLWSFHHVAEVAATERDPSGQLGLPEMAHAWETRNRRAFLAGYLATPGIGGLVPPARDLVRKLAAGFELERSASKLALRI